MKITVVVPGRNCAGLIPDLDRAFREQTRPADELIFVDDASTDDTPDRAREAGFRVIRQKDWKGPGPARNLGASSATADFLAFTDSDCRPAPDWLERVEEFLEENPDEIMMGRVRIPRAGFWGDAISDLGFPAGGNLGFEKVWHVCPDGYTDHLSSCNIAIRRRIYLEVGGFDERIPFAGCEDSELSERLVGAGHRIRYHPDALVHHQARTSLTSFARWHHSRGRSNFHFKRIVGPVGSYIRLRIWHTGNLVRTFAWDIRLPVLLMLVGVSFVAQQLGYLTEKRLYSRRTP